SPELLERDGYVKQKELRKPRGISKRKVTFKPVQEFKLELLRSAFQNFEKKQDHSEYESFCKEHSFWLDDLSLYKALQKKYGMQWHKWPAKVRDRDPETLIKEARELQPEIRFEKFQQFVFFSQWERLSKYAHEK